MGRGEGGRGEEEGRGRKARLGALLIHLPQLLAHLGVEGEGKKELLAAPFSRALDAPPISIHFVENPDYRRPGHS